MTPQRIPALMIVMLFAGHAGSAQQIIDRIVATVDDRILTLSDVRTEKTVRAILGDKPVADPALIQEMIDTALADREIAESAGSDVSAEEVRAELDRLSLTSPVDDEALRTAIRRRLMFANYIGLRFGRFLKATDEEIRQYYDTVFAREAAARGLSPLPALGSVIEGVRRNVLREKLDKEVEAWLQALRRRSVIQIFPEPSAPEGAPGDR